MIKKLTSLLAFFLIIQAGSIAYAQKEFTVNGMKYGTTSDTSTECTLIEGQTTAVLSVPETVEYDGVTYTVTAIGNSSFTNDATIKHVYLPKSVKSIGNYAFAYSKIEDIVLPENLTSVGSMAFFYASNLTNVYALGVNPPSSSSSNFLGCTPTVYVRPSALSNWEQSTDWSGMDIYETMTVDFRGENATYCSPFAIKITAKKAPKVYAVTGIDEKKECVILNDLNGVIPANTGVLIRENKQPEYDAQIAEDQSVKAEGNRMVGVLVTTKIQSGDEIHKNFVLNDNKFDNVTTATDVYAKRAYLQLPSTVPSISWKLEADKVEPDKPAVQENALWGNVIYSEYDTTTGKLKYDQSIYSFKPEAGITLTKRFKQSEKETICANGGGAYYDDLFHFILLAENEATHGYDVWSREYSYANDTLQYHRKGIKLNDYSLYAKAGVAIDPTTGYVYGIFSSQNNLTRQLGIIDYDNLARTTIAVLKNSYYAFAVNSKGEAYGITDEGDLMKIDKATGEETTIGRTGVTPRDMTQSATFDLSNDKLYWAAEVYQEDGSVLYEVDTTTGKATKIDMFPGRAQIAALYCPNSIYVEHAPAKVKNLTATFENGSLTGKIKFNLPSTDIAGTDISSKVKYTVYANGVQIATGEGYAGTMKSVSYTAAVDGEDYIFAVMPSNDKGYGKPSLVSSWIGHDIPNAPTDVKLTIDETGKSTLTWTAPTKGQHDGFIEEPLKYIITRYPGDILSFNYEGTTFTEQLPEDGLSSYYYTVRSLNGELYSEPVASNEAVYGSALSIPYYEDFSQESSFKTFTVVDANNDNVTWVYNSYDKAAMIDNSLKVVDDDWLITPAIKMEKNKTYELTFGASAKASLSPGTIAAAIGSTLNPSDYFTLVKATEVSTSAAQNLNVKYAVSEDGEYRIGFHATSPIGFSSMNLENISIVEDTTSGINNVETDVNTNGETYTLDGRRVSGTYSGLAIKRGNNGKFTKVIITNK